MTEVSSRPLRLRDVSHWDAEHDVVVVGQGPIGLLFSHMLSNKGARTVIAMDRLDYRLTAARTMKATHTVNVDREDPVEAVREITGGKMADLVVWSIDPYHSTVQELWHSTMDMTMVAGKIVHQGADTSLIPCRARDLWG